jgi:hypothetical protein
MKYVISSPSRTGSTLLHQILLSTELSRPDIVHTHNCLLHVDDPENTVLLFSLRRDLFRSIMSCLIAKRTKFYNYFENVELPKVESFEIDCSDPWSEFQKQYMWHKWYVSSHDMNKPYRQVETFYVEDFVNNYDLVYNKLGLTKKSNVIPTLENSYRYQDLVSNHEQCKQVFDQLEKTATFIPIRIPLPEPDSSN